MSRTHYAELERGNESNPHDEWSTTLCGLEYAESPLSNQIKDVDCKTCIKRYPKFEQQMTEYHQDEFKYFPELGK
jgi:hypothetical protein